MWLRLVTSQGLPYPSRSPRAHPSGWIRLPFPSVLLAASSEIKLLRFWEGAAVRKTHIVARTCNVRPQPRLLGTSLLSPVQHPQQA